jgi:hypothetical protein
LLQPPTSAWRSPPPADRRTPTPTAIAGTLGDYLTDPAVAFGIRHSLITALEEIGGQEAAYSLYRASRLEGDRRITDGALMAFMRGMEAAPPKTSKED